MNYQPPIQNPKSHLHKREEEERFPSFISLGNVSVLHQEKGDKWVVRDSPSNKNSLIRENPYPKKNLPELNCSTSGICETKNCNASSSKKREKDRFPSFISL